MNRREFIASAAALAAGPTLANCSGSACGAGSSGCSGRILFGVCRPPKDVPLLKSVGYRRADEVGVKTIVFGSGGARNVPGDFTGPRDQQPKLEEGTRQYTEFCRALCKRVADLKTTCVVIEPLRPNESNIINFVWQGVQICHDVNSPRLQQLADLFHMMMGRECADSLVKAGPLLKHCHIASYETRQYPGSDPATVDRLRPYFDALHTIGYTGGVSCECGWGKGDFAKNLETALCTLRSL